jgi:hypothetical protein
MIDPDLPQVAPLDDDDTGAQGGMIPAPPAFDLLRAPVPADWNDPAQLVRRTEKLVCVAHRAAERMVELILVLPVERAAGSDLLTERGGVMRNVDALFALHRELINYQRSALKFDGEAIVSDALGRSHGAGIAMMTMHTLAELRDVIVHEMQRHWDKRRGEDPQGLEGG